MKKESARVDLSKGNSFFDKLTPISNDSIEGLMGDMLSEENTPTKTEVNYPTNLTRLEMLGEWHKLEGYEDIAEFIQKFVDKFRINMISKKRKSRQEVVQMVSEMNRERSVSERLTSVREENVRK
jgi:hypothetical protein